MPPRLTPHSASWLSRVLSRLKIFWVLILGAVLTMGIAQLVLPPIVERNIERAILHSFDGVKLARVDVEAFPAVMLLGGRVSSIDLDVRRVALGDLTVDAILIDGENVAVDLRRLLTGNGVAVRSADRLHATFVITEDDLNQYFWDILNQSQFFTVSLERGTATLAGRFRMLGRVLDVEVSGHFRIEGGTSIVYVPQDVTVANSRMPQMVFDMIAEEWHIPLHFDQEAIPLVMTDLLVEDGKLLIYGTYSR